MSLVLQREGQGSEPRNAAASGAVTGKGTDALGASKRHAAARSSVLAQRDSCQTLAG